MTAGCRLGREQVSRWDAEDFGQRVDHLRLEGDEAATSPGQPMGHRVGDAPPAPGVNLVCGQVVGRQQFWEPESDGHGDQCGGAGPRQQAVRGLLDGMCYG